MSKVTAQRGLGLTAVFLRVAHYYLNLGYGEYAPKHAHYDRVVVRSLYEFMENPQVDGEYAGGTIVEFFQGDQRVRYAEFRCQVVGGGGQPIARPTD